MHTLQSGTSRPERLFDAMIKQSLLFIGCPMSDWLARFFIRIGRRERLIVSSGKTDFMVGDLLRKEVTWRPFLPPSAAAPRYFPWPPLSLSMNCIAAGWHCSRRHNLPRRWRPANRWRQNAEWRGFPELCQRRPARRRHAAGYARTGRHRRLVRQESREPCASERTCRQDQSQYDRCCLFIPIIFHSTLTQQARYFRIEWNHAQDLAERYPDDKRFILPVAIDETLPDAPEVPEKFRKLQWQRMQGGQAPPEFIDEISAFIATTSVPLLKWHERPRHPRSRNGTVPRR